jgi:hypothetical protein
MSKYERPCHAHNLVPRSDPMGAFVVNPQRSGLTRRLRPEIGVCPEIGV